MPFISHLNKYKYDALIGKNLFDIQVIIWKQFFVYLIKYSFSTLKDLQEGLNVPEVVQRIVVICDIEYLRILVL